MYSRDENNELTYKHFYDFSFAEQLQNASKNELWRNKIELWNAISAICDDAASKTYMHIENFIEKLIDVDTCSYRALKSIAQSIDLDFVTDIYNEDDFPNDIVELIDLLSVQKSYLMDYDSSYLRSESIGEMGGLITKRAAKMSIQDTTVSIDLLVRIKNNISSLKKVLNASLINADNYLSILITNVHLNKKDARKTLNDVFDFISNNSLNIKDYVDLNKTYEDDFEFYSNPFFLLIQVIREHHWTTYTNSDR